MLAEMAQLVMAPVTKPFLLMDALVLTIINRNSICFTAQLISDWCILTYTHADADADAHAHAHAHAPGSYTQTHTQRVQNINTIHKPDKPSNPEHSHITQTYIDTEDLQIQSNMGELNY